MCVCVLSHVQVLASSWTVACHIPLPVQFSRQKYWSGVPFTTPGGLPGSELELRSLLLRWQVDSLPPVPPAVAINAPKIWASHSYEGLFSAHATCPGAVGGSSAPCHLLAHRLKKQCLLQLFAEKKREWLSKVKLLIKVLLKWNTFISNCVGWSKSHGNLLGAGQWSSCLSYSRVYFFN